MIGAAVKLTKPTDHATLVINVNQRHNTLQNAMRESTKTQFFERFANYYVHLPLYL